MKSTLHPLGKNPKNVFNFLSQQLQGSKLILKRSMFTISILMVNFFFINIAFGQSISVASVVPVTSNCPGSTFEITFTTTNGNGSQARYTNSTVYTIYLSDNSGTNFTQIGAAFSTSGITYNSSNSGVTTGITKNVVIPSTIPPGTGYKISLSSTSPTFVGNGGAGASPSFSVSIAPAKPDSPIGQQLNLCGGGQFTYSVPNDPNATSYTWTATGAISFVSNPGTNTVTVTIPSDINHDYLYATAKNSCGSSPVKNINLWGHPTRAIITGPTCVSINQQNVVFSVTNPEPGAVYTWSASGAVDIVDGQGTPTLTVNWKKNNGNVAVIASNDCGSAGITRQLVTVGCASKTAEKVQGTATFLRVYPNPTSSIANIFFTASKLTKYSIEVMDKTGRLLQRKELVPQLGENRITLDLSKFTNGTYLVSVVNEQQRQTMKVVKN